MPLLPSPADRHGAWPASGLCKPGWAVLATGLEGALGGALADAAATGAAAVAAGSGLMLAARRIAGALPPPPVPLAALAVVAAGVLLVLVADRGRRRLFVPLVARCGLLMATLALAMPSMHRGGEWYVGTTGAGGWALTLLAIVTSASVALRLPAGRQAADVPRARPDHGPGRNRRRGTRSPPVADTPPTHRLESRGREQAACPGRLRQEQQRYEPAPNTDCMRGRLMLALPAGAKTAHGHVGFCPAFADMPRVQVTTDYDGVEAVVAVAEILPWGVRLECRLAEPAEEPLEIPIDFLAEARA